MLTLLALVVDALCTDHQRTEVGPLPSIEVWFWPNTTDEAGRVYQWAAAPCSAVGLVAA